MGVNIIDKTLVVTDTVPMIKNYEGVYSQEVRHHLTTSFWVTEESPNGTIFK